MRVSEEFDQQKLLIKEDYKGGGPSVEEVDEIIVEGCL